MGLRLKSETFEYPNGYANPVRVPAGTVRHAGFVLGTYVESGVKIMSDVWADLTYARVWDPATKRVINVNVGNSEFGMSHEVEVDASNVVRFLAERWERAAAIKALRRKLRLENAERVERAVARAKSVEKGRDVEVVRGRKVPRGTVGRVFWKGDSGYGMSVGIETATGAKHFTALSNVEVAQPDEFFEMPALVDVNARVRTMFYSAADAAAA